MMVLALLTVSCGKKKPKGNLSTARPVKVQVIGQNQMSLGYTASGSIKGIEEIPYTATSSGEVVVINGKNGDYVNAGQVIVAIDNQAARSGVREAVSNVRFSYSSRFLASLIICSEKSVPIQLFVCFERLNDNCPEPQASSSTSMSLFK